MILNLKIFVGYDPRETEAYEVFRHSVARHTHAPIEIIPLIRSDLEKQGLFWRSHAETAATEFSFTRFLVPYLSRYEGLSIFADCDMLMQADVWSVIEDLTVSVFDPAHKRFTSALYRDRPDGFVDKAVYVCKHDYVPRSAIKMDGQVQTSYPRKNWSSFIVFNNSMCRILTPDFVSRASGRDLHQFYWLGTAPEYQIGSLPLDWNWLVDEYRYDATAEAPWSATVGDTQVAYTTPPRNLHYTLGGPWFEETKTCDHADLWLREKALMLR